MCERELLAGVDGVHLERRELLRLSFWGLAGLCVGGPRTLAASSGMSTTWEGWIEEAHRRAERIVQQSAAAEERYLIDLAASLRRLDSGPDEDPERLRSRMGDVDFELLYRERPVLALQFRMPPGASLPYHDHQHQNGVMKIVSGGLTLQSFEPVGEMPPRGETFLVEKTADRRLGAGEVAFLGRQRDNIHGLTAGPGGAVVLDFFTNYRPEAHSNLLHIGEQARESERGRHPARIIGVL